MNDKDISKVMRSFPAAKNKFCGVFAAENIPDKRRRLPYCFIANTDPSWMPGQHWVAVYVSPSRTVEYFDSFGRRPMTPKMKEFCGRNYIFNANTLQSPLSPFCGQYCIYFLHERCRGKSFKNIMNFYNRNLYSNDMFVNNFVNYKYPNR